MTRVTLPERIFGLREPADVEGFLAAHPLCVVFKAGTSDTATNRGDAEARSMGFQSEAANYKSPEPPPRLRASAVRSGGCRPELARFPGEQCQLDRLDAWGQREPLKDRAARLLRHLEEAAV
jgi:hypothetical protein